MIKVIKAGFKTLSQSSRGEYNQRTDEVSAMRKEMLEPYSKPSNDKKNLNSDRRNIGNDMRSAISKIVCE